MKGKRFFTLMITFVFALVLCVPAFARASENIQLFFIDVTPDSDGIIVIDFSVTGTKTMDAIGAESISIYRESGSHWISEEAFYRDDRGMSGENRLKYGNVIYYDGESGARYKVVVEVFAENGSSYDSRSKTVYVTAR